MPKQQAPPEQGRIGQVVDSVCLALLILSLLFGPLAFGLDPARTIDRTVSAESWQALGQNDSMALAWERLGHAPETAQPLIAKQFDYAIDLWILAITGLAMIIYYLALFLISRIEYRDIISERFDR